MISLKLRKRKYMIQVDSFLEKINIKMDYLWFITLALIKNETNDIEDHLIQAISIYEDYANYVEPSNEIDEEALAWEHFKEYGLITGKVLILIVWNIMVIRITIDKIILSR
jgi:hypothetical protein